MNTSFERVKDTKDNWFTPLEIIHALGEFDLDPCTSPDRPWDTAKRHYTKEDDGYLQEWAGRVWLNPPYCGETKKWINKLADHGRGIALIYSRMNNLLFHEIVFPRATGIFFLQQKIAFHKEDGTKGDRAGCGSCLISFGYEDRLILSEFELLNGTFIDLGKLQGNYIWKQMRDKI